MWGAAEWTTQQCSRLYCLVMNPDVFLYLTFLYNPRQESEPNNSWHKPSLRVGKQWSKYGCRKARFPFLFVQCLREEKLGEKKFFSSIQWSLKLLIPFAIATEHPHDWTSWTSWIILQYICEWTVSKFFQANMVALFYSWSMGTGRHWASCPNPRKKTAVTPGMESLSLLYSHYCSSSSVPP